jgi:hypothetical protein
LPVEGRAFAVARFEALPDRDDDPRDRADWVRGVLRGFRVLALLERDFFGIWNLPPSKRLGRI